ncbi:MAG: hypothetical protein WBE21_13295 [Candidatus Acidiferrales bacterium]
MNRVFHASAPICGIPILSMMKYIPQDISNQINIIIQMNQT